MASNDAPIVAAKVLLQRGLADDVIVGYLARTWPLDDRHCCAVVETAHFLLEQETATRGRVDSH